MKSLNNAVNAFGDKIGKEYVDKIKTFCDNPTYDSWDDIKGIIIKSNFKSIWQAVIDIDSTFPRYGREIDDNNNIIKEWERIPTPMQVLRAIKECTTEKSIDSTQDNIHKIRKTIETENLITQLIDNLKEHPHLFKESDLKPLLKNLKTQITNGISQGMER